MLLECDPSFPEPDFGCHTHTILKSKKYQKEQEIEYIRKIKNTHIIKFKGIDSIGEAFRLVGYSVFVPEPENVAVRDTGWSGYSVRDTRHVLWGKVRGISVSGLNRIMEVENHDEIIYVPLCPEIIREINTEGRMIVIDPPDGLRKLNR